MVTKIRKWGNSLGVRIPKAIAQGARVTDGTAVRVAAEDGRLVLTPVATRQWDLPSLLARVNRKNLHGEVGVGKRTGREVW